MAERAGVIIELDDINELVRLHQARIRRFVTCSTGDPDLADTITQDTLLRAFNGRESFRGDCSLSTWLMGIAINVTRDHLRSGRFKFWKQVRASAIDVHEMASFLPSEGISAERRVPADHPLRGIREMIDAALSSLDDHFQSLYSRRGRPPIAPVKIPLRRR